MRLLLLALCCSLVLGSPPDSSDVVTAEWLHAAQAYHAPGSTSPAPPLYPYPRSHKLLVFETQWDSTAYDAGHVPASIHSSSDVYENGYPRWWLLDHDQLLDKVMGMGVGRVDDTTCIVYSDSPIFAARLWFILRYLGVRDTRYLDGGLFSWVAAGFSTELSPNLPVPTTGFDGILASRMVVTTEEIERRGDMVLIDTRSWSEFIGDSSGYDYLAAEGRVEGAGWGHEAIKGVYTHENGTLLPPLQVAEFWRNLTQPQTQSQERELVFYCGNGYRAALATLYTVLLRGEVGEGRLYSSGWSQWSTNWTEAPNSTVPPSPGWLQTPSGRPVCSGPPERTG